MNPFTVARARRWLARALGVLVALTLGAPGAFG